MPYCTIDDLEKRFGEQEILQLTDRDGAGVTDQAVVDQAIADADAEIDGYLTDGGYTTPLANPPYRLTGLACAIARYYLYEDARPEAIQKGYDQAIAYLVRVSEGKAKLDGVTAESTGVSGPSVSARGQVYGDDFSEQYG